MTDTLTLDPVAAAKALAPQIREMRDQIESERRLPEPLVEAMAQAGLFQLYVPRAIGGPEIDPVTAFHAIEEIAKADGSVGWCSFVASSVSVYAGWVPTEVGKLLTGDPPDLRGAGSFRPTGEARAVPGGYRVSGRWNYVSGVNHANWLFLNCKIMDERGPVVSEDGVPVTRMTLLPAASGEVDPTWATMGMRGTGSNDVVVDGEFVPDDRTFLLYEPSRYDGPNYNPRTVLVTGFALEAANSLGIVRGGMDSFIQLATSSGTTMTPTLLRDRQPVQTIVGEAEAIISGARAYLLDALGAMWSAISQAGTNGLADPGPQVLQARLAATHAIRESVRAVDMLFYAAGTNSIHQSVDLERRFRDLHTGGQHIAGLHSNFEYGGQALMGLTPAASGW